MRRSGGFKPPSAKYYQDDDIHDEDTSIIMNFLVYLILVFMVFNCIAIMNNIINDPDDDRTWTDYVPFKENYIQCYRRLKAYFIG